MALISRADCTLLGIGATLKQDLGCSVAEVIYGTTLCIPGEFFVTLYLQLPQVLMQYLM